MPLSFEVSAPGKVILFGEHSVVYGKTAVAASLDRRTRARFVVSPPNDNDAILVSLPRVGLSLYRMPVARLHDDLLSRATAEPADEPTSSIGHERRLELARDYIRESSEASEQPLDDRQRASLECLVYALLQVALDEEVLRRRLGPFELRLDSELEVGAGLGSSASYAVCLVAGFLWLARLYQRQKQDQQQQQQQQQQQEDAVEPFDAADLERISSYAFNCERIMHGAPSGIDNAVCSHGSIIEFRKGEPPRRVSCPVGRSLSVLLVDTRVARSTRLLVDQLAALRAKYPEIIEPLLEAMDALARRALELVRDMDPSAVVTSSPSEIHSELATLVTVNQSLLSACQVSHASLDRICLAAKGRGLSAKLTGAGGGGFAYVLIPPDTPGDTVHDLRVELETEGFAVLKTILGGAGVRVS